MKLRYAILLAVGLYLTGCKPHYTSIHDRKVKVQVYKVKKHNHAAIVNQTQQSDNDIGVLYWYIFMANNQYCSASSLSIVSPPSYSSLNWSITPKLPPQLNLAKADPEEEIEIVEEAEITGEELPTETESAIDSEGATEAASSESSSASDSSTSDSGSSGGEDGGGGGGSD